MIFLGCLRIVARIISKGAIQYIPAYEYEHAMAPADVHFPRVAGDK